MVHPFESLVGPFRFATQEGFARLAQVKGLRGVLERAIAEGRSAGLPAPVLQGLEAELGAVDSPSLERRKQSVGRVVQWLHTSGLVLDRAAAKPAPKARAASTVKSPDPSPKLAARPSREPSPGPSRAEPSQAAPPEALPLLLPDPPRTKAGRRVAIGQEESRTEARLLSLAPRTGPLSTPLKDVGFRVSPRLLGALYKREIRRVGDVLFLLPRCYEDRRHLAPIRDLVPGERGVVLATVKRAEDVFFGRGRRSFRAWVGDDTGTLSLTYFRGAPWLKARFPLGKRLVVSGELRVTPSGHEMVHPEVEPADDAGSSPIHFQRLVPIYPGLERQEQRSFRELAFRVVNSFAQHLEDPLPPHLRERMSLLTLPEAMRALHFPGDGADLDALNRHVSPAHRRLAFDELFLLQIGLLLRRAGIKREVGITFQVAPERLKRARALMPFTLTRAQSRAVDEIARDMARPEPMHRLLQGDVGSGKTAVAAVAASVALENGYQVALMAPTEILADQHHRTFSRAFQPRGWEVALLKGGASAKERRSLREQIAADAVKMVVGTHALFQTEVEFARLGLVLIDEQHRFGVLQRQALAGKGVRPDVLVMTATPIPRTLAMTLYGDLELSVLDELPPGRTPIKTRVYTPRQRARAYELLGRELAAGRQAFVVYPLVEESETEDLADAERGLLEMSAAFPDFRVGLLHGRMKSEEKGAAMEAFRRGELRLLASTTVVEVGVNVPNATVMWIEAAERFGLSQLHQLRGRVGRGAAESFCLLMSGTRSSAEAGKRLAVLEQTNDGFVVAEKDLELRGPGEFLGTRQSGIPELAVANLARDAALLAEAQVLAQEVVRGDPRLAHPDHRGLARALDERWEGRLSLGRVG